MGDNKVNSIDGAYVNNGFDIKKKTDPSIEPVDGYNNNSRPNNPLTRRRKMAIACNNGKWSKLLYSYALETSFHGPKQFVEPQPFILRRVIWLCIFLAGTAIFLMQVVTSIQKYYTFPVSVNVKVNYNTSILFPAVTICNGNAFRSTRSYEKGYYNLISEVYSDPTFNNFTKYGTTPTLDSLYTLTGHSLDDLFVSCVWSGVKCSKKDFSVTLTDFGRCFTFNGKNEPKQRMAYQTGSNGGLKLKLNIEQYEYMVGPNGGAGLKVLVHNPKDIPLVRDHGLGVSPGSHGLIGINTLAIHNEKPRYGICNDSVVLDHFPDYTVSNCYTDCKESYFKQKCGCRDIYMPALNGGRPVCNIDTFNTCMKTASVEFNIKVKETCECPVPCDSLHYQPSVSYGSISNFDIQALLRRSSEGSLQAKYIKAREVTQRVDKDIVNEDTALISNFEEVVAKLDTVFEKMHHDIHFAEHQVTENFQNTQKRIKFHLDRGLKSVKFIIEHDFIRGWEVYKERAFHYVTLDFMDFPRRLKNAIEVANETISLVDKNIRMLVYSPISSLFMGRKDLLVRTTQYINESSQAYLTGNPLLTYELTYKRRYDMSYITIPLLHAGLTENKVNYIELLDGIDRMNLGLDVLMEVGKAYVETGYFNESKFLYGEDRFLSGGRTVNYRLFMFESRVTLAPMQVIDQRIADFERLNRTFHENHYNVEWRLTQIETLHRNSITHWEQAKKAAMMSTQYLKNVTTYKTPLGLEVTSNKFAESIRLLTVFFQEIRSRVTQLLDMITILSSSYQDIYKAMLLEQSTEAFYEMMYNDSQAFLADNSTQNFDYYLPIFRYMLRTNTSALKNLSSTEIVMQMNGDFRGINPEEFVLNLEELFKNLSSVLDLSVHIGDKDALFLASFANFQTSLQGFIDGNKIGVNFFKENFLTLDVFMQELSFEEISQQQAYDIAQMLSEIGGSMGLFIGGSALSAFELVDVFLHHGAKLALHR